MIAITIGAALRGRRQHRAELGIVPQVDSLTMMGFRRCNYALERFIHREPCGVLCVGC